MAAHDPQACRVARQQLGCAPCHPGMREAVEAIAAQPPALAPLRRQRVGRRGRRERRVKGRVEAGDGRQLREQPGDGIERGQRLGLVQGGEIDELAQVRLDGRVDPHRARDSARRHARCDGRSRRPRPAASRARRAARHRPPLPAVPGAPARRVRVVLPVEQRQLEAARAGVDDQDAQARGYPGAPGTAGPVLAPGQRQSMTSGGSSPCSRV